MNNDFIKLSALVDSDFTVEKVSEPKWKKWDEANHKMLISDFQEKDYRKIYQTSTDKGTIDLSASQLGQMLESVSVGGKADVTGITFKVRSNGKTGIEIRYWLNPTDTPRKPVTEPVNASQEEFGEPEW